jgi:hypothetical protein
MSYYLFIGRVGGSTCLVKHVVFGLDLNVSGCNRVGHKPDMRIQFASLIPAQQRTRSNIYMKKDLAGGNARKGSA